MPRSTTSLRVLALAAAAIVAAAVVGTGGCTHNSVAMPGPTQSPTPSPSPTASGSPTPTPSPTATANYYISMAYASMSPTIDPVYGQVDGYALISPPPTPPVSPTPTSSPVPSPSPQTPGPSSVISLPCNTNVVFLNFDQSNYHTASLLVPGPGPAFPAHFNNANGPQHSPLLTPISFPNFSTGLLNVYAGGPAPSLVFSTGPFKGVYFIGDLTDYDQSPSMRTVITINC